MFHKNTTSQWKIVSDNNFTYRKIIDVLKEEINDRDIDVLDYGCGAGTISLYLGKKRFNVFGVDISKEAIDKCNESSKIMSLENFVMFSLVPKKFTKKFDVIICFEVIEHIKDDIKLIKLFHRLLKINGKLILSTPSVNAPLYRLGLAKKFDNRVGHLRRYEWKSLQNIIQESGFVITKTLLTEGVVRNALYLFPVLGKFIKFIKGPISDLITYFDDVSAMLFGESDIFIIAQKI